MQCNSLFPLSILCALGLAWRYEAGKSSVVGMAVVQQCLGKDSQRCLCGGMAGLWLKAAGGH